MKKSPHAFFTRPGICSTLTIEVNSRKPSGSTGDKPLLICLEIRQGMNPFWQYESGFSDSPIWNETSSRSWVTTDDFPWSYIHLLRMAVSHLTGGSNYGSKPRLGFHSKYRQRKRAELEAAA